MRRRLHQVQNSDGNRRHFGSFLVTESFSFQELGVFQPENCPDFERQSLVPGLTKGPYRPLLG